MLLELRRYAVLPGRMEEMHARMRDLLLPLFAAHAIPRPISIWENRDVTSMLSWVVPWPSFEARQAAWANFHPIYAAARQAQGTPEFVTRTTLTLITPWAGAGFGFPEPVAGCETAWHVQPCIGGNAAFMAGCLNSAFARFRAAGASSVNACNHVFGALPAATVLLGWPDAAARAAGMERIGGMRLGAELEAATLGEGGSFGARGEWELLDRARYL